MNELQRHFINQFQGGFPLVECPYSSVAADLDTDEATLILNIRQLLDECMLSRFGPLYDAVNMGGALTLAAMSVPEHLFEQVAQQVNDLPEIAHNYQRDHELNMWFVIATETPEGIQKTIRNIEQNTGLKVYDFPKLQEFYLGLWLQLDEDGRVSTRSFDSPIQQTTTRLDELDRKIIKASQQGLALVSKPYADIAAQAGCDAETVIERLTSMLEQGVVRRIGAIPNHYRLGLRGNGMSVWDVPDDRLQDLGQQIGQLDFVSHCYERPRHLPQWPYNLFAMVHGHDRDEVNRKVEQIALITGNQTRQHDVLFSSAILKKTGLRLAA
jgi:DNA-binding Lrp family transcriptional regulator